MKESLEDKICGRACMPEVRGAFSNHLKGRAASNVQVFIAPTLGPVLGTGLWDNS